MKQGQIHIGTATSSSTFAANNPFVGRCAVLNHAIYVPVMTSKWNMAVIYFLT
jgi:hypothetical protein